MKIKSETIRALRQRGINARWYPELEYKQYAKRMYDKDVEAYIKYYEKNVAGSDEVVRGYTNQLFESREELVEHAKRSADLKAKYGYGSYDCTTLYITYGEKTIVRKENVKSKEITEEYVLKLVEKNEKAYEGYYGEFALRVQRLLKANGYDNRLSVYPTTYGIGVWIFYNFHAEEDIQKVENILKEKGVEYYNEYSDKHWVYRFKISKKEENVNKIKL